MQHAGPESTVLLVDDDRGLTDLFTEWLSPTYDVHVAHSGEAALELLAGTPVDLVLLDRKLPDISGDEVLVTLRDWGVDAPVAMVSGKQPETDIVDLGFDDYLRKPVERADVRATVERLLRLPSYDSIQQELTELRVKRNVLELEHATERLAKEERYQCLVDRIDELEERAQEYRAWQPETATIAG